jgi:hypothetical protein
VSRIRFLSGASKDGSPASKNAPCRSATILSAAWRTPAWSSAEDLADLIQSFTTNRQVFVSRLRRMSERPHSLLVVTAPLAEIKSEYPYRAANPNRITQSLIAVLAGLRLPFICTDTHELGEEIVASYLYQTFLYDWLERNGHGRYLADGDL